MAENISNDLDNLLERLSNSLLSPTADDSNLRKSPYERSRVGANVEYARTLLLRLEHSSRDVKTQTRKQSLQNDLQVKRDLIKRLNQRLIELNQLDDESSDEDEEDEDAQGVMGVREYAPAVKTTDGIDTNPEPTSPPQFPKPEDPVLRSRKPQNENTAQSDAAATAAAAAISTALFGARTAANPTLATSGTAHKQPASTEQILDESRREQDLLTTSLVQLAQNLKTSSLQFSASLESEKEVLARAEQGLDKNATGMEAAESRMGALRRMTEGQGWWGRIKLYAIIAALWVAAFLLVFIGPKFRF